MLHGASYDGTYGKCASSLSEPVNLSFLVVIKHRLSVINYSYILGRWKDIISHEESI